MREGLLGIIPDFSVLGRRRCRFRQLRGRSQPQARQATGKETEMRYSLLSATALLMLATPAVAKDGSWYGGIEAGILFPKSPSGGNIFVDYTTTNAPVAPATTLPPLIPAGPADTTFTNPFNFNTNTGWDGDIIGGYDFGMFRVEGEIGYKQ